jgi:hypothetical protein
MANSKNHYIRLGKYGPIARMKNPTSRNGPVAGRLYPSKHGEPVHRAINNEERKEASILTHTVWIGYSPGTKKCHFLDIIEDQVGPCGVEINHEKILMKTHNGIIFKAC